jgi:RNA ligase (TIGR02306 family)
MTERKLATIRRISQLLPIEGADKIQLALIDGWQCVVQKGLYMEGDLAVYMEVDSWLDASDPRYASFEERFSNWDGRRGMRVKTIKLRGTLSQGLLMPIQEFKELKLINWKEGDDVTSDLKIVKWEPVEEAKTNNGGASNGGGAIRVFPSFVSKTDQPRVQNMVQTVSSATHKGEVFERTIKLDGSSLTAYLVRPDSKLFNEAINLKFKASNPGLIRKLIHGFKLKFGLYKEPVTAVCSRNLQLRDDDGSNFWAAVNNQQLIQVLECLDGSHALQGELLAPNIQDNHEKVKGLEFRLFDVYDIDKQKYWTAAERQAMADEFEVKHTPIDFIGPLSELMNEGDLIVPKLLELAEGPGMNKDVKREGHVYKSTTRPEFTFKVISNSYLLAKEKKQK